MSVAAEAGSKAVFGFAASTVVAEASAAAAAASVAQVPMQFTVQLPQPPAGPYSMPVPSQGLAQGQLVEPQLAPATLLSLGVPPQEPSLAPTMPAALGSTAPAALAAGIQALHASLLPQASTLPATATAAEALAPPAALPALAAQAPAQPLAPAAPLVLSDAARALEAAMAPFSAACAAAAATSPAAATMDAAAMNAALASPAHAQAAATLDAVAMNATLASPAQAHGAATAAAAGMDVAAMSAALVNPAHAPGVAATADAAAMSAALATPAHPPSAMVAVEQPVNWQRGTVKLWLEEKVFGFIVPDGGGDDVMVHKNVLPPGLQLVVGMPVLFESVWEPFKGKFKANRCIAANSAGGAAAGLATTAAALPTALPFPQAAALPPPQAAQDPIPQHAPAAVAEDHLNLFIGGLPLEVTEETIKSIFGQYGAVTNCAVLPQSELPGKAALVSVGDPVQAAWFVNNLHQNIPVGLASPIVVRYAQHQDTAAGAYGKATGRAAPDVRIAPYSAGAGPTGAAVLTAPVGSMQQGTVKAWIEERGMGFIAPMTGGDDIFVHRSCLVDGQSLVVGSIVMFEVGWDSAKNKPMARACAGAVPQPGGGCGCGFGALPLAANVPLAMPAVSTQAVPQPAPASLPSPMHLASAPGAAAPDGSVAGTVRAWIEDRGMGFVAPQSGGDDFFAHRSDLVGVQVLEPGTTVTFVPMWDNHKGKPIAKAITPVATPSPATHSPPVGAPLGVPAPAPSPQGGASAMKGGTVRTWFEEKGFGFISIADGSGDAFVHRNDLSDGTALVEGAQVFFEVRWNEQKRKNTALHVVGASGGVPGARGVASAPAVPLGPAAPAMPAMAGFSPAAGPRPDSIVPDDSLFVKGLPLELTEESVRALFGQYGSVVSVKVLPPEGRPDKAAFVRMGDPSMAKWICDNLHMNIPAGLTTPIDVRFATHRADPGGPAPAAGASGFGGAGYAPLPVAGTVPGSLTAAAGSPGEKIIGVVRTWIEDRGMGFIAPSAGGDDFFVHRTCLLDGQTLTLGSTVSFEAGWDPNKGKPVAKNVLGAVPAPAAILGVMRHQLGPGALAAGLPGSVAATAAANAAATAAYGAQAMPQQALYQLQHQQAPALMPP